MSHPLADGRPLFRIGSRRLLVSVVFIQRAESCVKVYKTPPPKLPVFGGGRALLF